jgi:hypothetical protein
LVLCYCDYISWCWQQVINLVVSPVITVSLTGGKAVLFMHLYFWHLDSKVYLENRPVVFIESHPTIIIKFHVGRQWVTSLSPAIGQNKEYLEKLHMEKITCRRPRMTPRKSVLVRVSFYEDDMSPLLLGLSKFSSVYICIATSASWQNSSSLHITYRLEDLYGPYIYVSLLKNSDTMNCIFFFFFILIFVFYSVGYIAIFISVENLPICVVYICNFCTVHVFTNCLNNPKLMSRWYMYVNILGHFLMFWGEVKATWS